MSVSIKKIIINTSLIISLGTSAMASHHGDSDGGASKSENTDWRYYAKDQSVSKYANLDQINKDTVKNLKMAWSWDSIDNTVIKSNPKFVPLGFKSSPIKIGRVLYINTTLGHVAAIDAGTGKQLWTFDTNTVADGRPANMGFNTRGVSYWEKGGKHRIIVGTNNAYLWSLDAATGLPDKTFGTDGKIDLTLGLGRPVIRAHYSIVAAPVIVDNTVVIGGVIMDGPVYTFTPEKRSDIHPGHIRGIDVETGKPNWLFHSIPQEGEKGNETWEDGSWKTTGGSNVWSSMSVDPELGYIYLPFGTPNNDWYGGLRLGDNLYSESLVCLNAKTGKLVWHYQMVHHGLWDYDLPTAPNLVDITVDGKAIKAVAQITKQGFVFVFNRVNGEPVWPIEERPVPQSRVPGERTSPTQPFPTKPAHFDVHGISEDTLIDFTPEIRSEALERISQFNYGPIFTPPSLKGTIQMPGDAGGASWSGGAYDPETGMLYIPSFTREVVIQLVETDVKKHGYKYIRSGISSVRGPKRLPLTKPPYGRINALNLNTGDYEWVVPNGEGIRQKIIDLGIPDPGPVGRLTFVQPLVTKSLLFTTLTDDKHYLKAIDKKTGETVFQYELPAGPQGAPITYMLDGKQYISVAVGGAKDARLVALVLP